MGGGLLTWANQLVADQAHDQMAMLDITVPEKDALTTEDQPLALDQYAGPEKTTGQRAKAVRRPLHRHAWTPPAMAGRTRRSVANSSR